MPLTPDPIMSVTSSPREIKATMSARRVAPGCSVTLVEPGDYSRGASGFWIENGEITHPVSEITVAGNLKDMFARLVPADDLERRFSIAAPSIMIEGLTIAGR